VPPIPAPTSGQDKTDPGKSPAKPPDKTLPGTPPGTIPGAPGTPGLPGLPGPIPPSSSGIGAGPVTGGRSTTDPYEAYIRLEPPGRERLFGTRDTERELEERMRQERKDTDPNAGPIVFPEKPELTAEGYQTRQFAPTVVLAEPDYVVYRRLYFEDKNAERYGWDLGPIQPLVSTLYFLKDVALFPNNFASYPCRRFETNAGQCLPGDPVPYLCYPPELTWTGMLAEAGVIGLLFYVIP
jgi:hypothetical protein